MCGCFATVVGANNTADRADPCGGSAWAEQPRLLLESENPSMAHERKTTVQRETENYVKIRCHWTSFFSCYSYILILLRSQCHAVCYANNTEYLLQMLFLKEMKSCCCESSWVSSPVMISTSESTSSISSGSSPPLERSE